MADQEQQAQPEGTQEVQEEKGLLDQKPRDKKLRPLIARKRDRALDRRRGERALDRGQEGVLCRGHLGGGHTEGVSDSGKPGRRAVVAHGGRAHDGPPGGRKLAHGRRVEGVDRGHHLAIQRGIELAPLTAGNDRTCRQTEWREHPSDTQRVRREHFAQQGHCRTV